MWGCKHDWIIQVKTYAQTGKEQGLGNISNLSYKDHTILVNGLTTVLFQCFKCQKLRKEKMLGKEAK